MPGVGTTHHVKIGAEYYLVKPGSYSKRVAPQFGARFTSGDPDYNNLSMWQHWAQSCWIGGADAPLWTDDSMFDESVGVDSTTHEQLTMARGFTRGAGLNWTVSSGTTNATYGFNFTIHQGRLFCATQSLGLGSFSHVWHYDATTDAWARYSSLDASNICIRSSTTAYGSYFVAGLNATTSVPMILYSNDPAGFATWYTVANPAGVTQAVTAMRQFQQKLYVAFGEKVWRWTPAGGWDGNTVFYDAGINSTSNHMVSMETHLGFLYMLSSNGHVHRTDGNTTFDIWSWDGQTTGVGIKSFDGRLFVLTWEATEVGYLGQACLYQMSGSAMTQLKRWGDEIMATLTSNLVTFDRKLFYGASNVLGFGSSPGFGLVAYDPIEDAHSIVASNLDTASYPPGVAPYSAFVVSDMIVFQGRFYIAVLGHGIFQTAYRPPHDARNGSKRYDISKAGGSVASMNGGWLTTSTYDAGTVGLRKMWRKITIDYSIPSAACAIVLDYSIDGGATWTTASTVTTVGGRVRDDTWLENVISNTLKLRFTFRSTDATVSPSIYGFLVSYIPVVEPNWIWSMTLVIAEKLQLLDGTTEIVDTEARLALLRDTYRTKQLITFTDVDSSLWASGGQPGVLIQDIGFHIRDLTQPLEGEVTLTLLEAVETY